MGNSVMLDTLKCISPVDGSVYVERPLANDQEVAEALARARQAQAAWRYVALAERQTILGRAAQVITFGRTM